MDNAFMMFLGAAVLGYFGFVLFANPPVTTSGQFVWVWAVERIATRCTAVAFAVCGVAMLVNGRIGSVLYLVTALGSAIAFAAVLVLDARDVNASSNQLLALVMILVNGYGAIETVVGWVRAKRKVNVMEGEG